MKDAIVIAGEKSLFEVIFCELVSLGYSVGSESEKGCRVLIVNADIPEALGRVKEIKHQKLILISRTPDKNASADTVLFRPVRADELRAAVAEAVPLSPERLAARPPKRGHLSIDPVHRTVSVDSVQTRLSQKEFALFCVLYEKRKCTVSRETLADAIGASKDSEVDVYICYLRRKLEKNKKRLILTERGKGYKLI